MRGRERNAGGPRRFSLFMAVLRKINPARIHEKGANFMKRISLPLNQVIGRYVDGGHENGGNGAKAARLISPPRATRTKKSSG